MTAHGRLRGAVLAGLFAATASIAGEAPDADTPTPTTFTAELGVGVDALEPWSLRGLLRTRGYLTPTWALGFTLASRGAGLTGTLDVDARVWTRGPHSVDVGPRAGMSWRRSSVIAGPWTYDLYLDTWDVLAGAGVAYRRELGTHGLVSVQLDALGAWFTVDPALSYRVAPVAVFVDVGVGLRVPVRGHRTRPPLQRALLPPTDTTRLRALRRDGIIVTTVGLTLLVGGGVVAGASNGLGGVAAGAFGMMPAGFTLVAVGAPLWGVADTKLRKGVSVAAAPTQGGGHVVVHGTF